jgi:type II secretory pathway pseudopilin PulG
VSQERAGESGTTVAEMTVVVALLSLVLAMSLQSFNNFQSAAAGSDRRVRDLAQARAMMAVLTKDLRTGSRMLSIAGNDVTFLAYLNTTSASAPPNRVRLYVDGQGRMFEAVTPPDNPAANPVTYTGAAVTRPLGANVTGAATLFRYLDGTGATTATLTAVRSVTVTLTVSSPPSQGVAPTTLSGQVWLPNIAASSP